MTAAQLLLFIGLVVALVYQFACRAGRKSGGKALAAKARESSGAPPSRSLYPASEGFFAIADRGPGEGLRLIVDNGLFYEFVLLEAVTAAHPERRWLADAVLGTEYALVVSSCAGLWAYVVADTVRLIMRDPPRLLVTGRLSYFLSAFGQTSVAKRSKPRSARRPKQSVSR